MKPISHSKSPETPNANTTIHGEVAHNITRYAAVMLPEQNAAHKDAGKVSSPTPPGPAWQSTTGSYSPHALRFRVACPALPSPTVPVAQSQSSACVLWTGPPPTKQASRWSRIRKLEQGFGGIDKTASPVLPPI